jgi:hypothetical protein
MPVIGRGMTQRAIWLGQQLNRHRTHAGITLSQAGDYLGRNGSSISRSESGEVPARIGDVVALMNLYGVDDDQERANLENLAREVWQKGWIDPYRKTLRTDFIDYAWVEARASEVRQYDGLTLAGLLQTRDYAESVIRAVDPDEATDTIQRFIEYRMQRQSVLDRVEPFLFRGVIDEGVLHRTVGNPKVMRDQFARLIELTDHERIELRILPFSAGAHPGQAGAFHVFTQPYPYALVGYAETPGGSVYVEAEEAERFQRAYDRLESAALDPRRSAALLKTLQKDLE